MVKNTWPEWAGWRKKHSHSFWDLMEYLDFLRSEIFLPTDSFWPRFTIFSSVWINLQFWYILNWFIMIFNVCYICYTIVIWTFFHLITSQMALRHRKVDSESLYTAVWIFICAKHDTINWMNQHNRRHFSSFPWIKTRYTSSYTAECNRLYIIHANLL